MDRCCWTSLETSIEGGDLLAMVPITEFPEHDVSLQPMIGPGSDGGARLIGIRAIPLNTTRLMRLGLEMRVYLDSSARFNPEAATAWLAVRLPPGPCLIPARLCIDRRPVAMGD